MSLKYIHIKIIIVALNYSGVSCVNVPRVRKKLALTRFYQPTPECKQRAATSGSNETRSIRFICSTLVHFNQLLTSVLLIQRSPGLVEVQWHGILISKPS